VIHRCEQLAYSIARQRAAAARTRAFHLKIDTGMTGGHRFRRRRVFCAATGKSRTAAYWHLFARCFIGILRIPRLASRDMQQEERFYASLERLAPMGSIRHRTCDSRRSLRGGDLADMCGRVLYGYHPATIHEKRDKAKRGCR